MEMKQWCEVVDKYAKNTKEIFARLLFNKYFSTEQKSEDVDITLEDLFVEVYDQPVEVVSEALNIYLLAKSEERFRTVSRETARYIRKCADNRGITVSSPEFIDASISQEVIRFLKKFPKLQPQTVQLTASEVTQIEKRLWG
ncbi:MAG TPA: hypothetical protein PLP64_10725 [Pseudothermotoga sp.]|nr:hypothetical protein [Pseudothermotoga sp.]HOK84679.1 hypothetical protein [Pseudothermotoga sp.]HPP71206.1 hypothetical protein [Pseudothermotoga sp.]